MADIYAQLISLGLSPVPINPSTKRPPTREDAGFPHGIKWKHLQTGQPSEEDLATWRKGFASAWVGVVCGAGSKNLEVLDFDIPNKEALIEDGMKGTPPAYEPWIQALTDNGYEDLIDRLVIVETVSGGCHVYFRCEEIEGNQVLAANAVGSVLIETRGQGGLVVCPPSPGYEFVQGDFAAIPTISAEEREGLFLIANLFDQRKSTEEEPAHSAQASSYGGSNGGLSPFDDYDSTATWEEVLEPEGWVKVSKRPYNGQTLWRRPGKTKGYSAIVGPGTAGDRFKCLSTSAGLPVGKALKKSSLLSHFRYGGDFSACAKDLKKRGYGSSGSSSASYGGSRPKETAAAVEIEHEPAPVGRYLDPDSGEWREYQAGDIGNAERFVAWFGRDMRYVPDRGWYVWYEDRWKCDTEGALAAWWLAQGMSRRCLLEAANSSDLSERKWLADLGSKLTTKRSLEAMLALAKSFPQIAASADDFDRDPYLLGVKNGTLNLKTGEIRPADPGDMITMQAACKYEEAECPEFLKWFEWAMQGNQELMRFIMLSLGYALTGSTKTQAFWFCIGEGGNGKSTLTELMLILMGSYGGILKPDSIMVKKNDQIPADLATLVGKRYVFIDEVQSNRELDAGLIKAMSAFSPMQVRFLHGNFFNFKPKGKIWITGNERPKIRNFDPALRRRMHVVPFNAKITEKDDGLKDRLVSELPGILWLLVQAFHEYDKHGLCEPSEVSEATDEYQNSEDKVREFIDDMCELGGKEDRIAKKKLRDEYLKWCKTNQIHPLGRNDFYKKVENIGVMTATTMTAGQVVFEGIRFKGGFDYGE